MGRIYLKDGRALDLTMEESIDLYKLFVFIPEHKTVKVKDEVFCFNDIDHEAYKRSQLPQQTGMNLVVDTVDIGEKKTNQ